MPESPEIPEPPENHRTALIGAPKKPDRRWAFVLVDLGKGVNVAKDRAQELLFSQMPGSIRSYYREASYGIQDLDGEVFGPLSFAMTKPCDTMGVADALRPMIAGTFTNYLWYFGSKVTDCPFAGLATLGTADKPSRDSWYNAATNCVVLIQEPGHNFGMMHSSNLRCSKGGVPVSLLNPGEGPCTHTEYGNPYDPMGSGCNHANGFQKAYEDWLKGCNVVKATSNGTFTLFPLEKACNGAQLIQVSMAAPRTIMAVDSLSKEQIAVVVSSYYLELRAPIGIDQRLTPKVLVTIAGEIRDAVRRGSRNWLLDMTPETGSITDAALPVGRTFKDPDPKGPSFTVLAADATQATLRIEVAGGGPASDVPGEGLCDNTTPFVPPGPATCEDPAQTSPGDGGSQGTGKGDASAGDPGGQPDGRAAVETDGGGAGDGGEGFAPPFNLTDGGNDLNDAQAADGCSCRLASASRATVPLAPAVSIVALLVALRRRRRK